MPIAVLSVLAGVASLTLMWRRRFVAVRITALAVTALLWSWSAAQYPFVLPGLELTEASATESVLIADSVGAAGRHKLKALNRLFF